MKRNKLRIFVSFHYLGDRRRKQILITHSRHPRSPFEISDASLKWEARRPDWERYAEKRIRGCDMVWVLLGRKTHRAPGVLREVRLARKWKVPLAQIRCGSQPRARPVPGAGKIYPWKWDVLRRLCRNGSRPRPRQPRKLS